MKQNILFRKLLLLAAILLVPITMSGQVTIGSGQLPSKQSLLDLKQNADGTSNKGLHLPRLTTEERDALTSDGTLSAEERKLIRGLSIYNIDTRCYEYWNEESWISLCAPAKIILEDEDDNLINAFNHTYNGIELSLCIHPNETPEPSCGVAQPFSVIVISGNAFLNINIVDASTGSFTYSLDENTSPNSRTAIIRILNNCTQAHRDFLVNQEGNSTVCYELQTGALEITVLGSTGKLCAGSQTILGIANVNDLATVNNPDDFVWARNGVEAGRGTTFYTTQTGKYQLFLGGLGCPEKSEPVTITLLDEQAPKPVLAIDAENNGVICDDASITLTAYTHPDYTNPPELVQWLKNDELSDNTGEHISVANVGDIYAAVVINTTTGCVSKTSNKLLIRAGSGSKPNLTAENVLINGVRIASNPTLCPGSTIRLEVDAPQSDLTYEWYINSNRIGTGSIIPYSIPADESQLIVQCVVSGTGSSCVTSVTLNGNLTAVKPAKPVINSSSSFVCAASTLTLATDLLPGVAYQWFRNGLAIAGQTANTLTISNAGRFEVQASVGVCQSDKSEIRDIFLSGAPTSVMFTVAPSKGTTDAILPFQATGVNVETWSWSPNGKFSASDNGAEYSWATEGEKTVTAMAENACGTTPVSTAITIEDQKMSQPEVEPVSVSICGGGAQYKVDLSTYPDANILTDFSWIVKRDGTNIPYRTLSEKSSVIQFEYIGTSATYTVQAIAVGVGRKNSDPSTEMTVSTVTPSNIVAKLHGVQIFDVAKTGSDLAQRRANIEAGGSYSYKIYNGVTTLPPNTNTLVTFDYPAFTGATFVWAVDDPDGLLSNADEINGTTNPNISLTFDDTINNITNGQSKTIMLSCVIKIDNCEYPVMFPIKVQDKFACGTGGIPTKLWGTTVAYGDRISQRAYDTYTFPTSDTDLTPKCWMIEDSAEGTNVDAAGGCRNGKYARQTDNSQGFHYFSGSQEKHSACPAGWRLPVGGGRGTSIDDNPTEMGKHFRSLQKSSEYKAMWYINFTGRHGYDCTATYYEWCIWSLAGTDSWDHEAWIRRLRANQSSDDAVPYGDSSHNSFSARCVKDVY